MTIHGARPHIEPRHLEAIYRPLAEWTTPEAYLPIPVDPIEYLRAKMCAAPPFIRMARALGWYLAGTVVVGCGWLIAAGVL
jgi:hypothetical protein